MMFKRKKFFSIMIMVILLFAAGTVFAAWGGQPDGNQHPMVGAMFADWDGNDTISGDELTCSGSYAGPSADGQYDVFLTAGHCVILAPIYGFSQFFVSFDNEVLDADGPADLIASAGFAWHPGFGHDLGDLHDLGVVLLPAGSVSGIAPVQLPPAGFLNDLKADGSLRDTEIDLVGYGVVPVWRQPGGTQFQFDGVRRSASGTINGLTRAYLKFLQNPHATGQGGVCFGDSGSPQLIAGTTSVVSVTSGGNGNCNANNYNYRLDTASARDFLGQFLELP